MKHRLRAALGCAVAMAAAAGCNDFLSGPGIDQDPNNVTKLTEATPILTALEAAQAIQFEGQTARLAAMYTQQLGGAGRQFQGYDTYLSQPTDLDPYWQGVFSGGGLLDARKIQDISLARGDSLFAGIGKFWEAMIIGNAASWWGDIPYRQAAQVTTFPKPVFDPQLQVYADVQAKLDTAIAWMSLDGPTNIGPKVDLDNVSVAAAHTLKARFYMHLAEKDPSNYAKAAAEAAQGINDPADDFLLYHNANAPSQNIHFQFYQSRGDVGPGAAIINLMKARFASGADVAKDRLQLYFVDACGDESPDPTRYFGYRPAGNTELPGGAGSPAGFLCPTAGGGTTNGAEQYSDFNFVANDPAFRMPLITFAENKLIQAEAAYQMAGGGAAGVAAAQPFLNAVRQNEKYGDVELASQPLVPATLQNIMEEKYIDLFLNPEVFNDYKRTCLPFLAPAPTQVGGETPGPVIAGRFPYGLSEFNTNVTNVPTITSTGRNANDPAACPRLDYSTGATRAY